VLIISAIVSMLLLLVLGHSLSRGERLDRGWSLASIVFAFVVAPLVLGCALPCVVIQGVLLFVLSRTAKYQRAGAAAVGLRWNDRRYFALACVTTVLVYGAYGCYSLAHLGQLRRQYHYVSIEARLPVLKPSPPVALSMPDGAMLDDLEERLRAEVWRSETTYMTNARIRTLEGLHGNAVFWFVSSFGFGIGRMEGLAPYSARSLHVVIDESGGLVQPIPRRPAPDSTVYSYDRPVAPLLPEPELESMYRDHFVDFTLPQGFGYFLDRQHVAGFVPHRLRKPLSLAGRWNVERLELVGLVVHEKPVVYVSELLPRMDILRDAAVRPPDSFETAGLANLKDGQTLFLREHGKRIRLLGAIRATMQCTACHGCERGELLGAFSYVLRKE
jgi:hypothetical protein